MSDKLPQGWLACTLGDVVNVRNGYAFPSNQFQTSGVPVIRQSNLAGDRVSLEKCIYLASNWLEQKPDFILRKNDVLIGMSGSVGKLCIYDLDQPALQNQRTGKVVPRSTQFVEWRFVWEFLKTVEHQLLEKGKGMGVLNVSAGDIESLPFNLAPLGEQRRIVTKLEMLLGKVAASQQRLAKIPVLLKRFRQSILAAACSGRLTADWREQNGTTEADWKESKLADLLAQPLSNGRSVVDATAGFPVLRLTCLKNGRIDLAERKIGAWTVDTAKRFLVSKGDFFVSRGNGSLSHVGRGGLVEENPDGVAFPDTLIRVRVQKELIEPTFLRQVWGARPVRDQIESAAHTTAGIWKISQKDVDKFVLPVPPLLEQQEIVRRVTSLFALADQLEARLGAAQRKVDALTPSLLARAFSGRLVPQDPNDEPATVLLERIRGREPKGHITST